MDLGSIKIYFELDHFLVSSFVGGMFINNGFFLISFMGFKDCSLFVLVDEERQEMQWEELGEEGEKQVVQGAGVEVHDVQNEEGGEEGEKQAGQGGTRSEKCAARKNALPRESKATQGESEGSMKGES